jgi:hypothetical protein
MIVGGYDNKSLSELGVEHVAFRERVMRRDYERALKLYSARRSSRPRFTSRVVVEALMCGDKKVNAFFENFPGITLMPIDTFLKYADLKSK